ncbi:MAG TPA: hypothetical protein VJC39_05020 [Candidatus Nanoarchaeia archaeon]|nr:hypothetical protein [Candidatus Nanoarchaeia archaeon]
MIFDKDGPYNLPPNTEASYLLLDYFPACLEMVAGECRAEEGTDSRPWIAKEYQANANKLSALAQQIRAVGAIASFCTSNQNLLSRANNTAGELIGYRKQQLRVYSSPGSMELVELKKKALRSGLVEAATKLLKNFKEITRFNRAEDHDYFKFRQPLKDQLDRVVKSTVDFGVYNPTSVRAVWELFSLNYEQIYQRRLEGVSSTIDGLIPAPVSDINLTPEIATKKKLSRVDNKIKASTHAEKFAIDIVIKESIRNAQLILQPLSDILVDAYLARSK